jgi:hypothetical protein
MDKVGRRNYADNNRGADRAGGLSARTSAAVRAAITSGAACGWSSTTTCPFLGGPRRVRHEDPRGHESGNLPRAHVSVFRRGAAPPVTRTRSQPQTKQQPAGDGRALLPFVRGERLTPELGDARLRARKEERAAGAGVDHRRTLMHGREQSRQSPRVGSPITLSSRSLSLRPSFAGSRGCSSPTNCPPGLRSPVYEERAALPTSVIAGIAKPANPIPAMSGHATAASAHAHGIRKCPPAAVWDSARSSGSQRE